MTKRMPPHPGRYISNEMEHLNISLRALARALDVSPSTIGRVVEGNAAVTPGMAVRLASVIGSTPEMWLRLQEAYSLAQVKQEIDLTRLTPLFTPAP
ncbi:HigA family addiction module antitoxin [Photorhabdus luminescens]|uniref:Addiction module antidote protein, HigA family n=2 Tax=Photorhabdus luminescens TaxID=29488 RepID=A0A5C4REK2_PHOLU|nr:HigA family addiction module antitoxin [Photorhabdus luminescens]MCW7760610.1 HigA family addiction module antitoxin [Photorhabdus luminescens subsp. venezuelensis]TDB54179.1 addiction module antidote protein, HigA family [Photorhabdus luminescens subsp. mexicana]TNH42315.1 addiction module antidote protein, HigA family [Photorhabdus luminescens subsp. sonorensis]